MLFLHVIRAVMAIYYIALHNFSTIFTPSFTNSTISGLPIVTQIFSVTGPQMNTDICLFTWPIQRHTLNPTTTLNNIATTLNMHLKPTEIKPITSNTCPSLLPIQQYIPTVTTINDVAAIVAIHFAANNTTSQTLDPTSGVDDIPPRDVLANHTVALILVFLSACTFYSLIYRRQFFELVTLVKEHLTPRRRQQQELGGFLKLENAQTQLAGQAELIHSVRMQVEASQTGKYTSASWIRQLQAISSYQHTKLNRPRNMINGLVNIGYDVNTIQPTLFEPTTPDIPFSLCWTATASPSSPSLTSSNTTTLSTSSDNLPNNLPNIKENSGSPPAVPESNKESAMPSLSQPTTVSVDACGNDDSLTATIEQGATPPPPVVDHDHSWTVVRRHKKRWVRRVA